MTRADVSRMDAQCVKALTVGDVRAVRFCSGTLGEFIESGCLRRWLERLAESDGGPSSQTDEFDFQNAVRGTTAPETGMEAHETSQEARRLNSIGLSLEGLVKRGRDMKKERFLQTLLLLYR